GIMESPIGEGGIAGIEVDVAGQAYAAHIDSGSMGGIGVNEELAAKLKFKDKPIVVGRARSANSDVRIRAATLDGNVTIAGQVLENPKIEISPMLRQVNIGSRVLQNFIVTFDQRHSRVRFERAAGDAGPIRILAPGPGGKLRLGVVMSSEIEDGVSSRRIT